jgi:hypothetical protein
MIDDISVDVAKKGNGKSFSHYNVYLNNEKVDETEDEFYVFHDLPKGDHTAGVSRQYTTGESAIVEIPFVSECEMPDPTYKVTFIVTGTGGVNITDAIIEFDGEITGYIIENVANGTYPYTVSKDSYEPKSGTITVNHADKTETVALEPVGVTIISSLNVILYPNPFTNEINISNPELVKNVRITNTSGQTVKDVIFNGKSIVTSELASGIYFVTVEGFDGEKAVYKMVNTNKQ